MKASKKRMTRITVVAAALGLIGGGAYAYWTLTGDGTGDATTGTVTGTLTVNQTSVISDLRPGGAAQTLSGDFDNSDDSPVYVTSVTVSIDSVVPVGAGTCDATDYTLSNTVMTVNAQVASGTGVGAWTGATIAFNNKALVNQDACQGATVNFAYTTS